MTDPEPQPDASKLLYVPLDQLDPCELPPLLLAAEDGTVTVATGEWTCKHGTTWNAVPVGTRGGTAPQMVWIIRPPTEEPAADA